MKRTLAAGAATLALTTAACAAQKAEPKSAPSASSEAAAPSQQGYPQAQAGQPGYGAFEPQAAPPPPSAPSPATPSADVQPSKKPTTAPGAQAPAGGAPSRAMALAGASREIDASQRELDVAAGDCTNACRALGSMDRATGRLCELAQEASERRRCDEAKDKVYSARDRVKAACRACPAVSVERADPIPSR